MTATRRDFIDTRGSSDCPAVEAVGLTKTFGEVRAIDGVDLMIPAGGIYGFLGPNGAGKTTTIRVLATLLKPNGGNARIFGRDVVKEAEEVRKTVALTGQFASVDEDLTGRENILMLARLRGFSWPAARKRTDTLLETFGLIEAADRQVKTYSGGMRRRIDIAASIVVTPELLFLDEPTTGLDPRNRLQVWDIVRQMAVSGTTVLLTTQYLDEADQLAGRIAVIDNGRIIAEGTSGQLKAQVGTGALHLRLAEQGQRDGAFSFIEEKLKLKVRLKNDDAEFTVRVSTPENANNVVTELAGAGIAVASFSYGQPSLDEVFLTLTGHSADVTSDTQEVQS